MGDQSSKTYDSSSTANMVPHLHRRRRPPFHHQDTTHEHRREEEEDEEEGEDSSPANSQQYDPDETDVADEEDELISQSTDPESSYSGFNPANSSADTPGDSFTTLPTYINVAPLPIFRGRPEECPVAHLSRFSRVSRANNASTVEMMIRIFPVTLDDEAALWYELNVEPYVPSLSWDDIKSSFLKTYRRTEFLDQSRSELMMIRQGEHETVNAFYLRMQWILKKWPDHGLPDVILNGVFIDGLREDFQDWIIPQRPGSIEEALRLALSWEQAQAIRAARRRQNNVAGATGSFKCGFCEGPHEEKECQIRQKMKELWMRRSKEREAAPEEKAGEGGKGGDLTPSNGNLRLLSPSTSMVRKMEEEEGGRREGGLLSFRRRSQCQCWKHQCWKRYERSNSSLQDRINPASTAAE